MELRDLEYFAVSARHPSLAKASEALGLSAAALSKSLRRLETAVEAKLMERAANGIALTSAGRLLLSQVEKMRLALDDVKREASEIASGRAGRVRIGAGTVDCEHVAEACTRLLAEAPDISFEVLVSTNDLMVPQLLKGELDLIVNILLPVPAKGTTQELLFSDTLFACAAASHPLAKVRRIDIADVAAERWMVSQGDVLSRQRLENAFQAAGLSSPNVALESRSIPVRLIALANSRLLGVGSERLLRAAAARGLRLARVPVKELAWPISIGVITRKSGFLPRSAQRLIELMRPSRK